MWGKVIEATKGARGEFAYPQSLYVPTLRWREVELLSRYGVPIEVCNPYALGGKSWR
ncbi:MAG TPA: hypothetical protein VFC30_04335 [Solirubrobacteraceae bacterium]|nr:hypothetical protein [Solirubrobacteraceae bacterium]